MAETKPTATVSAASKATTSVQPKKSTNIVSFVAPIVCIIAGYLIWRFILGNPDGFPSREKVGSGRLTKDLKAL
jgi:biopolymer transport protein ExbB